MKRVGRYWSICVADMSLSPGWPFVLVVVLESEQWNTEPAERVIGLFFVRKYIGLIHPLSLHREQQLDIQDCPRGLVLVQCSSVAADVDIFGKEEQMGVSD